MPDHMNLDQPANAQQLTSQEKGSRYGRLFRNGVPCLAVNISPMYKLINIRLSIPFATASGLKRGDRGILAWDEERQMACIMLKHAAHYGPLLRFGQGAVFFSTTLNSSLLTLWNGWLGKTLHYYEPTIENHDNCRCIAFSYADIMVKTEPSRETRATILAFTPDTCQQDASKNAAMETDLVSDIDNE